MTEGTPTGARLDRALQRRVLEGLREHYPEQVRPEELDLGLTQDDRVWNVNAYYLYEHQLVDPIVSNGFDGLLVSGARITAKGMDFLEDDGGLTAILGVLTVKLDASTLRALLEARVEASNLPAEKKSALKEQFRAMSGEALKEVTTRFVSLALDNWPAALDALQKMVP